MKLNEVTPGLDSKLAPTDCRLRPDQRATELGQYDKVRALGLLSGVLAKRLAVPDFPDISRHRWKLNCDSADAT